MNHVCNVQGCNDRAEPNSAYCSFCNEQGRRFVEHQREVANRPNWNPSEAKLV